MSGIPAQIRLFGRDSDEPQVVAIDARSFAFDYVQAERYFRLSGATPAELNPEGVVCSWDYVEVEPPKPLDAPSLRETLQDRLEFRLKQNSSERLLRELTDWLYERGQLGEALDHLDKELD